MLIPRYPPLDRPSARTEAGSATSARYRLACGQAACWL